MSPRDKTHWVVSLSRYARALAGSDAFGDKLVARFASQMLSEPDFAAKSLVELLHGYHDWLAMQDDGSPPPSIAPVKLEGLDDELQRRIARLGFRHRALVLLVAIADLPPEAAGAVLRLTPGESEALLEEAWRVVGDDGEALVLIVENDALTAMDIAAQVEELGHRVLAVAPNAERARQVVRAEAVDLVITDLSMGGEATGLELVEELCAGSATPVILVTGHPERAIGLRSGLHVQVLSKPFDAKALQFALLDALAMRSRSMAVPQI